MVMKNCKECKSSISSKAKRCPSCGLDQRNWFMRHKFITGILVVGSLALIGDLDSDNSSSKSNTDNSIKAETVAKAGDEVEENQSAVSYGSGDTAITKKFEVQVTSIEERTSVGSSWFNSSPSEGGVYLTVQWQYKNISDEPIGSFSTPSIYLVDENGVKYTSDISASGNFATELELDRKILSDLNPGITVKDAEVFEISKERYDIGEWKLIVKGDEEVIFNAN